MAGYVEKQVAAAQKTVADAIAGKQLKAAIKQLQDRSQIKDTLKTLPARGAITAKRNIGKRVSKAGIASPLTETGRTNFDEALVYSSSGLFVFRFAQVSTLTMLDANGSQVAVVFKQQTETA